METDLYVCSSQWIINNLRSNLIGIEKIYNQVRTCAYIAMATIYRKNVYLFSWWLQYFRNKIMSAGQVRSQLNIFEFEIEHYTCALVFFLFNSIWFYISDLLYFFHMAMPWIWARWPASS